jgi:hypothetical protein
MTKGVEIDRPYTSYSGKIVANIVIDQTMFIQEESPEYALFSMLTKENENRYYLTMNFSFKSYFDYLVHKYYIFKFKINK